MQTSIVACTVSPIRCNYRGSTVHLDWLLNFLVRDLCRVQLCKKAVRLSFSLLPTKAKKNRLKNWSGEDSTQFKLNLKPRSYVATDILLFTGYVEKASYQENAILFPGEYESEIAGEESCHERVDVSPEGAPERFVVSTQSSIGGQREEVHGKPIPQLHQLEAQ